MEKEKEGVGEREEREEKKADMQKAPRDHIHGSIICRDVTPLIQINERVRRTYLILTLR